MGYLGYYFAWLALSYLIRQPWLLAGLLVLWLLRGVVPPPGALFGALSRAGRLREQVRVNRANITARRDLATIYLDLLRPRRAIPLLEAGLALAPGDAELSYLLGLALHRARRHEEALPRLLAAIEKDHRLRHGAAYLVAGAVLLALERWDDAADAFERYLDFNSSDVGAHTQLARAYAGQGDAAAARKWLRAGLQTWHGLPGAMKRRQLGAYLKGQWTRATVLHEPLAIGIALLLGTGLVLTATALYPSVVRAFHGDGGLAARARQAYKACGSQRLGRFAGKYQVEDEGTSEGAGAVDVELASDRIRIGAAQYCLSRVFERQPDSLHAEAILIHPIDGDAGPADAAFNDADELASALLYDVRLNRHAERLRLRVAPVADPTVTTTSLILRRLP